MEETLKSYLSNDSIAIEAFNELRLAQPPKDRLKYFNVVMEGTAHSNSILLQKLYTDIIARSNINFGAIPDSNGNLVRYKEYPLIQESLESLNRLFEGISCENLKMTNELHDMIISCKKDYEFGFTRDIEMIKISYNIAVMSLYEMINLCILTYTKKMKDKAGIQLGNQTRKTELILTKNVRSLLKQYKNGQWAKIMNMIKKDPHVLDAGVATEAGIFGFKDVTNSRGVKETVGRTLGDAVGIATSMYKKVPTFIKVPLLIVAALVVLFFIIRALVCLFWNSAVSLRDWAKTQKEFVDIVTSQEKEDGVTAGVIKKHEKIANKLDSISTFIEVKLIKNNKKAEEDIANANKENYGIDNFKEKSFPADSDITF